MGKLSSSELSTKITVKKMPLFWSNDQQELIIGRRKWNERL
jgi:hypothetical protein